MNLIFYVTNPAFSASLAGFPPCTKTSYEGVLQTTRSGLLFFLNNFYLQDYQKIRKNMTIRKIKKNEIDQLVELYFHYISEENLPSITKIKMDNIWNQIESNPCINYFVLEVEEKIIASCILTITPSFIRGGDGFGIIEHVVTNSDFRRKGFGESIVKYSLDYAWGNGCTEVMLLSGSKNKNAHKMYEKIGFDKYRKTGFIMYKPGK